MDVIEIARSYLDALLSHDADRARLAPDARRIDNGRISVEGADALRAIIRREPVARMQGLRWVVDGDQAIVFYDLDASMDRAKGGPPGPEETWIPAYIGERFAIRNGAIEEIEVVYTASPGQPRPPRPARYARGEGARDEVLSAAKAYVAALLSHDASEVPLAEKVWRIENGRNTADGADALRASLESDVMQTVAGIEDERWFAGGDGAAVFYTLRARVGESDVFVRIAERFRVVDGHLVEIEAVFAPRPA